MIRHARPGTIHVTLACTVAAVSCDLNGPSPPETETLVLTAIEASEGYTCAVTVVGDGYCWGRNGLGQLGAGAAYPLISSFFPIPVAGEHRFEMVAAGGLHACGIDDDGRALCWGSNQDGQLGVGSRDGPQLCQGTPCSSAPSAVEGEHDFSDIGVGSRHTCGINAASEVLCWGENTAGQLGTGAVAGWRTTPVPIAGDGTVFVAVATGAQHSCALSSEGRVSCWGRNGLGELGSTAGRPCRVDQLFFDCSPDPDTIAGGHRFLAIRAGGAHTCGLTAAGEAWCWGANGAGQLGVSQHQISSSSVPVRVEMNGSFASLTVGGGHTCGITTQGEALCWGGNLIGQLGDCRIETATAVPSPVCGGVQFEQLSAGGRHSCGVTVDGGGYCWGDNDSGALGSRSFTALGPVPVVGTAR